MNTIPMTDLVAQYTSMRLDIDGAIERVLSHASFILGEEVRTFEQELAAYAGVRHAVGVASGTDALFLALLACGVGAGDEVITTSFSFIATSESIVRAGATPVFVDVDPQTLNLDLDAVARAVTSKTGAILPVHLYGRPCNMTRLMAIARDAGLHVVEDCAQAQGAVWGGRQVGAFGTCGCFSFFPSKMLGACGDGGMVITDRDEIAEKLRVLRNHGASARYHHHTNGFNSRLDSLQAAVLKEKLPHLPHWISLRRRIATRYAERLAGVPGIALLAGDDDDSHVYNYYTILVHGGPARRDALGLHLKEHGIASAVYYPKPLPLQEVYAIFGCDASDFPDSVHASQQVLSLPIYPEMTVEQVERVAGAVSEFCL